METWIWQHFADRKVGLYAGLLTGGGFRRFKSSLTAFLCPPTLATHCHFNGSCYEIFAYNIDLCQWGGRRIDDFWKIGV